MHENVPSDSPVPSASSLASKTTPKTRLGREYDARAWIAPDSPTTTATAVIIPSVGKQTQSQRRNAPSFGFGTTRDSRAWTGTREPARRSGRRDDARPREGHHGDGGCRATRRGRRAGARATYWSRASPAEGTVRQGLYPNSVRAQEHARAGGGGTSGTGRNVDCGRDKGRDMGVIFFSHILYYSKTAYPSKTETHARCLRAPVAIRSLRIRILLLLADLFLCSHSTHPRVRASLPRPGTPAAPVSSGPAAHRLCQLLVQDVVERVANAAAADIRRFGR